MDSQLIGAIGRYAERFHAALGVQHQIASPLGGWLLLALIGSGAPDPGEVSEVLGFAPADALARAEELLATAHPAVDAAAAIWSAPGVSALPGLPAVVASGPLPTQDVLDRWASDRTHGLIDRFPVDRRPETLLLLATALATRIGWTVPFDLAPASALGGPWSEKVSQVLSTPPGAHESAIVRTARAGDVAVHTASAEQGLRVTSVIADRGVPARDVLAVAHEVAQGQPRLSLFALPLGVQPHWTITEESGQVMSADGREEWTSAVLPAWSARDDHDLSAPELGFSVLAQLVPGAPEYEVRQAAVARYHRRGFEAAAVTAGMIATGAPHFRAGLIRTAELRFGHPYAVVATAVDERWSGGLNVRGPWHGVPVFSAWVADPEEPASES